MLPREFDELGLPAEGEDRVVPGVGDGVFLAAEGVRDGGDVCYGGAVGGGWEG